MNPPDVTIAGIRVEGIDEEAALDRIESMIATGRPHLMVVVNASKLVLASEDPELQRIISSADLVTADGMSVVWGARLLGARLPGRVTGIDTMEKLVARAADRAWRVFFLGAKQEALDGAISVLKARHPSLVVAGSRNGYFAGRENEIIAMVREAKPHLLFVAMGSPAQERFLSANLEAMAVPFSLGVGGSFDHVAGISRRAPVWMQRIGMEWLYRFASEPRRLWRRYLIGNTRFALLLWRERRSNAGVGPSDGR